MSTHYQAWIAAQAAGQQIACALAGFGLLLVLGWLLIGRVVPGRWHGVTRWSYLALVAGLGAVVLLARPGQG